jgi:hypothetical protein
MDVARAEGRGAILRARQKEQGCYRAACLCGGGSAEDADGMAACEAVLCSRMRSLHVICGVAARGSPASVRILGGNNYRCGGCAVRGAIDADDEGELLQCWRRCWSLRQKRSLTCNLGGAGSGCSGACEAATRALAGERRRASPEDSHAVACPNFSNDNVNENDEASGNARGVRKRSSE